MAYFIIGAVLYVLFVIWNIKLMAWDHKQEMRMPLTNGDYCFFTFISSFGWFGILPFILFKKLFQHTFWYTAVGSWMREVRK